jgi:hypothetical protein
MVHYVRRSGQVGGIVVAALQAQLGAQPAHWLELTEEGLADTATPMCCVTSH